MLAFLNLLREKYEGAEGYAQQYCGLTTEDIQTIRRNLLVNSKLQICAHLPSCARMRNYLS